VAQFGLTSFEAGGCITDDPVLAAAMPVGTPEDWSAPRYLDHRPYCLEPNDQGQTSTCVGQAVAGWIEVHNWLTSHVADQEDGFQIYSEAKEDDPFPGEDGTSLMAGFHAAQRLALLPADAAAQRVQSLLDLKFALHRDRVVIGSFEATAGWNSTSSEDGLIGSDNQVLGGHAVLICYYSDQSETIGWQNSWGPEWGVSGFGRMTYPQFSSQWAGGVSIEYRQGMGWWGI